MRSYRVLPLILAILILPGCLAKTAFDTVTAPVRVAGRVVDLATTSQSESDEKRGRALREQDEKLGKLEREYSKQRGNCMDGDRNACVDARSTYQDIQTLLADMPQP
ncbi:hypothetical protein [Pontixanthobacter sp.]|uniref:hypothetical protein n=1 Tax=Pontixanthobacter sp. TaxID=2792078 RepID=UPI003C7CB1A7